MNVKNQGRPSGFQPYRIKLLRDFEAQKTGLLGTTIVLALILTALLAPLLALHDPYAQNMQLRLQPPSLEYPFGTDQLGRCMFSRVVYGSRISLAIASIVVICTASIGTVIGLVAGYGGRAADEILMRLVDIVSAFPSVVLAMVIVGILGPGLEHAMMAMVVVGWTRYARVVRGSVLDVKKSAFVESARALGASSFRILTRHILPEVLAPVLVTATFGMGSRILLASSLSFLGLGAQPPMPEWGAMLSDGRSQIWTAPHIMAFAGLAVFVTVTGFQLMGDGIQNALNPWKKRKVSL